MTVSVVLPTYERGAVVGGAIESVLAQTHADLKLLVVDGGSTDDTEAVVASFDDPRLSSVRRSSPAGVSAARNAGVAATDGEWVAFVDSDDRWHPTKLERQLAAAEGASGCGVVYCGITKAHGEALGREGASGDVHDAVRRMAVPTYTSILLVRREAFETCGGFDEDLPCFEDWEFCLRLARDWAFRYVDEPLVVKGTAGENVSADPENLARAVRRLRRRYDLPDETLGRLLTDVGVTHCEAGRLAAGRPYLRRALRFDRRPNAVAALAFSLTGSEAAFRALMDRFYDAKRLFGG